MTISANTAGVFPISFGYYPQEGSRAISAQYDWTSQTSYNEDLSQLVARGVETTIQGVFADNSTSAQFVTMLVSVTGQVLIIPPGIQGVFPLFFTGNPSFTLSVPSVASAVTRLIFLNVPPQTTVIWSGAAGAVT
jgi:hypothetical protein